MKRRRAWMDVAGTFTDGQVREPSGARARLEVSTAPRDPAGGFLDALEKAARRHSTVDGRRHFVLTRP